MAFSDNSHPSLRSLVYPYPCRSRESDNIWVVHFDIEAGALHRLESTEVFITQPPITSVMVFARPSMDARRKLHSRHGFTMKDFQRAAVSLLETRPAGQGVSRRRVYMA